MPENVLEKRALINGEWVESESGERFEVHYPGDGRVVGTAPICTRKDVQRAVEAARQGQQALAKLSLLKRIELLHKAVEIAGKSDSEAARILCMETGKPLQQSISEASPITVTPGATFTWLPPM